jgi:DNA replication protein DnaC
MSAQESLAKIIREKQRLLCGERYVGSTLSKIRAPEWAQLKIQKFIENPKNFLVYFGDPGIGKTYLCSALIEWAVTRFNNFRYWNEGELLKRVRKSIDESSGDYVEALSYMIDDELVILDDIGSTGLTEFRKEILFDAIEKRYSSMLPTVITSNFTRDEFYKNFHERFCSRLFASENIVIEIKDGFDFRKENENEKT